MNQIYSFISSLNHFFCSTHYLYFLFDFFSLITLTLVTLVIFRIYVHPSLFFLLKLCDLYYPIVASQVAPLLLGQLFRQLRSNTTLETYQIEINRIELRPIELWQISVKECNGRSHNRRLSGWRRKNQIFSVSENFRGKLYFPHNDNQHKYYFLPNYSFYIKPVI